MTARYILFLLGLLLGLPLQAESLYDAKSYRPLASDKRAHLPGDALTILIYENSSATTSADTALQRNNQIGIQLGLNGDRKDADVGLGNRFDGGGSISMAGKLLAQMTVTVQQVAANGDLWIAGEQILEINADTQRIKVEGRIRPQDISEANTVLSYRIADAKISYLGEGELAARQRPGFWSRLFSWAGF